MEDEDHTHSDECFAAGVSVGSTSQVAALLRESGAPPAALAALDQASSEIREALETLVERHLQIKIAERLNMPAPLISSLAHLATTATLEWPRVLVLSALHSLAATLAGRELAEIKDLSAFLAERAGRSAEGEK